MATIVILFVSLLLWGLWLNRGAAPRPSAPAPPPAPVRPAAAPPVTGRPREPQPDIIGGWLFGHYIAHDHDGFPGDPLPGGHLGSAANLAFWGSIFDEEDEDW